ncbi:hypothetical protein [Streptomyces sp. NPDC093544]|uniref:hypothetical protein n=1 Tax=Streptomyces sp. NPDC093544 TaxID=3155200 RepID=UPI0034496BAA
MLRLHFTAEDLARVQVATELDPLWETVLGLQQLRGTRRGAPAFRAWRRRAGDVVEQRQLARIIRGLGSLIPNSGYTPDFLTPHASAAGVDAGLDAIRGTPPGRLRLELHRLADGLTMRKAAPYAASPPYPAAVNRGAIHPITVEWVRLSELATNPRTGKLIEVVDERSGP